MPGLSQVAETRLVSGDGRRFVVAKRLAFEVKSNGATLVTELLRHRAYRDTFLTPDSGRQDSGNIHGPFALSDIQLEDFEVIDMGSARQAIEAFWAPGASEGIQELIRGLDLDHSRTLRLAKSSRLEAGFQEFVVIDPTDHVVTLVVLASEQ
jgi:hypothetical protein